MRAQGQHGQERRQAHIFVHFMVRCNASAMVCLYVVDLMRVSGFPNPVIVMKPSRSGTRIARKPRGKRVAAPAPPVLLVASRSQVNAHTCPPAPKPMDHRWGERVSLDCPALLLLRDDSISEGQLRNASISGAWIDTDGRLPVYAALTVIVSAGAGMRRRAIELPACVVRNAPGGSRWSGATWEYPRSSACCTTQEPTRPRCARATTPSADPDQGRAPRPAAA